MYKISHHFWYQVIVYCHFAYNSGEKLKSYLCSLLRYGIPDLLILGTLKNKMQISQNYEPFCCELEVRYQFRVPIIKFLLVFENLAYEKMFSWIIILVRNLKKKVIIITLFCIKMIFIPLGISYVTPELRSDIKFIMKRFIFWQICNLFFRVP